MKVDKVHLDVSFTVKATEEEKTCLAAVGCPLPESFNLSTMHQFVEKVYPIIQSTPLPDALVDDIIVLIDSVLLFDDMFNNHPPEPPIGP